MAPKLCIPAYVLDDPSPSHSRTVLALSAPPSPCSRPRRGSPRAWCSRTSSSEAPPTPLGTAPRPWRSWAWALDTPSAWPWAWPAASVPGSRSAASPGRPTASGRRSRPSASPARPSDRRPPRRRQAEGWPPELPPRRSPPGSHRGAPAASHPGSPPGRRPRSPLRHPRRRRAAAPALRSPRRPPWLCSGSSPQGSCLRALRHPPQLSRSNPPDWASSPLRCSSRQCRSPRTRPALAPGAPHRTHSPQRYAWLGSQSSPSRSCLPTLRHHYPLPRPKSSDWAQSPLCCSSRQAQTPRSCPCRSRRTRPAQAKGSPNQLSSPRRYFWRGQRSRPPWIRSPRRHLQRTRPPLSRPRRFSGWTRGPCRPNGRRSRPSAPPQS
mmetsp:Transcript_113819/g.309229  ORF Transcript_113819/g.309229 Transcript_113819/m.309229 type:complete len:379 (-) Transcript_113819:957-2093(-)